jgi:hypothetical protein
MAAVARPPLQKTKRRALPSAIGGRPQGLCQPMPAHAKLRQPMPATPPSPLRRVALREEFRQAIQAYSRLFQSIQAFLAPRGGVSFFCTNEHEFNQREERTPQRERPYHPRNPRLQTGHRPKHRLPQGDSSQKLLKHEYELH